LQQSNFANEHLRNFRRNKFMVELLAASRRIPIEPPGGSAPPLGDPANPSYSVAVHNEEAEVSKAKHAAAAEAARLLPNGGAIREYFPESMSSGVFSPAAAMMAGLAGRRNGSLAEGRRSIDDILPRRS
jgi:hypothetical protein